MNLTIPKKGSSSHFSDIDERRIREWKQKHEELATTRAKKGRVSKKRLTEKIINWIHERRENMLRVSRKLIMKKAKILYDESVEGNLKTKEIFAGSGGWLEKFINKIVACLLQAGGLSEKLKYNPASIIAMDETALWEDMTASVAVETTGKKEVSLKKTGHDKVRISACLSASVSWSKT